MTTEKKIARRKLKTYNNARPHQGRGMNGRTPARAFVEGLPANANQQEENVKKSKTKKAA